VKNIDIVCKCTALENYDAGGLSLSAAIDIPPMQIVTNLQQKLLRATQKPAQTIAGGDSVESSATQTQGFQRMDCSL
jgi:hypothetical protein